MNALAVSFITLDTQWRLEKDISVTTRGATLFFMISNDSKRLPVVILGHESCGAVTAALMTPVGQTAGSPSLDRMIPGIRPGIEQLSETPHLDPLIREPVKANALAVAEHLVRCSQLISKYVEEKGLLIVQGIYSLTSGKIEFSDSIGKMLVDNIKSERPKNRNFAFKKAHNTTPGSVYF